MPETTPYTLGECELTLSYSNGLFVKARGVAVEFEAQPTTVRIETIGGEQHRLPTQTEYEIKLKVDSLTFAQLPSTLEPEEEKQFSLPDQRLLRE